jgi:hypothetical protein
MIEHPPLFIHAVLTLVDAIGFLGLFIFALFLFWRAFWKVLEIKGVSWDFVQFCFERMKARRDES